MDKTWIKLYRRIKYHEIMRDPIALQVFVWILLSVHPEKGSFITGSLAASEQLGMPRSTFRGALKRLENWKITAIKTATTHTEISLLNWSKYQSLQNDRHLNRQPTASRPPQLNNKNKNTISKDIGAAKKTSDKKPSCPLLNGSPLRVQYPNGHKECVDYYVSEQDSRGVRFVNDLKQFTFIHKILRAGYGFDIMDRVIVDIEVKYGSGNWDFGTVSNWIEKGGGKYAGKKTQQ
jgi:hypothetical protein